LNLIITLKNFYNKHYPKTRPQDKRPTANAKKNISIKQKLISRNALQVIKRLRHAGYEAYLVGGSVRDLLLGLQPKDFDVATDATPEQIRKLFRNCRLIGRRFRLAHIHFGGEIIEVSTFRRENTSAISTHRTDRFMVIHDNTYGTQQEDAVRRDFTLNALYYDPKSNRVIDTLNGIKDLAQQQIRIIGDANIRYQEDPIRMIRAIRFAGKLNFDIETTTAAPFSELNKLLWNVAPARLFEEVLKLFFTGHALASYQRLKQYHFFNLLFPQTIAHEQDVNFQKLLHLALENTDKRLATGKSINPAFLLAVILWYPLQYEINYQQKQLSSFLAQQQAMRIIIKRQLETLVIPRRLTQMMCEIWQLQYRLPKRHGKRAFVTSKHLRFRAAYDFLLLRSHVDSTLQPLANWWTEFQHATSVEQFKMTK